MRLTQTSRDGQLSEEENEIRHFIQHNNPEKEQTSCENNLHIFLLIPSYIHNKQMKSRERMKEFKV